MASMLCAVVFGLLLNFSGSTEDTPPTGDCHTVQRVSKHIELCHHRNQTHPEASGPYQCGARDEGFVLVDLQIAPRSNFADCGLYRVTGLLDAKCLRHRQTSSQVGAKFDAAIWDLLGKVSGRHRIENDTAVERVPFVTATSSGKEGEETEDSSAFLSFKKMCKRVRPEQRDGRQHNGVVNICRKGKVTSTHVFLALNHTDLDHVPPDTAFRCRCTLQPSHTLTLRALDVRLQQSDTRSCMSGVHVKIQSPNQTSQELSCQGLSAHYGSEKLFSSEHEVTLDLYVSTRPTSALPAAMWIQGSEDGSTMAWDPVIASCEDVTLLDNDADKKKEGEAGMNMAVIGGVVAGLLLTIIVIIVFIIIRKRRRNEGVAGHVYAEPHNPLPSRQDQFNFPEEDPQTPPPLPDTLPPGAPLVVPNPVSKPARTFSYGQDSGVGSDAASNAEEYDRLILSEDGGKWRGSGTKQQATGSIRHSASDGRCSERYDHLELDDTGKGKGQ